MFKQVEEALTVQACVSFIRVALCFDIFAQSDRVYYTTAWLYSTCLATLPLMIRFNHLATA